MQSLSEKYKGIHPGVVLGRELQKRNLKQRPFALSINEHPQTFNAIVRGRRNLPTALALKIENKLGLKEGDLVILQAYFDIAQEKRKSNKNTPDLNVIRKLLFWDTDFEKIDWEKQYKAVIRRVFERGNEAEKNEIRNFYGEQVVKKVLETQSAMPMELHQV